MFRGILPRTWCPVGACFQSPEEAETGLFEVGFEFRSACHSPPKGSVTLPGDAGVAQLAEQLFCKQQVIGSIPFAGSGCAPAGRDLLLVDGHEPMQVDQVSAGALSRYSKARKCKGDER